MKYKVGDKVRIVNYRTGNMNGDGEMDHWLGEVMTIREIAEPWYRMEEDKENGECDGGGWWWRDEDIAGFAAEHVKWEVEYTKDDLKAGYKVRLRPLDECKARDEGGIWVDSMDTYAGNEVTVRHLNTLGFNAEGTYWSFPYGAIEEIISCKGEKKKRGTEPSPMPVEDTFKLLFGFE